MVLTMPSKKTMFYLRCLAVLIWYLWFTVLFMCGGFYVAKCLNKCSWCSTKTIYWETLLLNIQFMSRRPTGRTKEKITLDTQTCLTVSWKRLSLETYNDLALFVPAQVKMRPVLSCYTVIILYLLSLLPCLTTACTSAWYLLMSSFNSSTLHGFLGSIFFQWVLIVLMIAFFCFFGR